jgi:hypothetical protein
VNHKPARRSQLLAIASIVGLACIPLCLAPAAPADAAVAAHHASEPALTAIAPGTSLGSFLNYFSGLCLGISGGLDHAPAVQFTCLNHPDQKWSVGQTDESGYYQIINGDGQCLGVQSGSAATDARVVAWTCEGPSHPDQYWYIDTGLQCGGEPYYPIFNQNSGDVVGVSGNSLSSGAAVVQWPWQDQCNNQEWIATSGAFG